MYEAFLSSGWVPVSSLLVLFLFCFGLCAAIAPRRVGLLGRLWQRKREPGTTTLVVVRLLGILLLLITLGLGFLFLVAAFLYSWEY